MASPVHVRARFDGKVFVPDEPVDLPQGAILEGLVQPVHPSWPPGFIERTMGAWPDAEVFEAEDPLSEPLEPLLDLSA